MNRIYSRTPFTYIFFKKIYVYICVCIYGGKNTYVYNISESIKKVNNIGCQWGGELCSWKSGVKLCDWGGRRIRGNVLKLSAVGWE